MPLAQMTKPLHPRRRPFRPLRSARPLLHAPGPIQFSGLVILDEYDGEPGLLLWELFRDAELWASADPRRGLFSRRPSIVRAPLVAELPHDPYAPIKPSLVLLSLLPHQRNSDAPAVGNGCDNIARWSHDLGRLGTAVEYQQVASLADPRSAIYAVRAARWLRMRAEYARAWSWFDHAIVIARRETDWQAYCEAHAGVGNLHVQVGNYPRARIAHRRVLRTARREHIPDMVASAYHNLFVIEMEVGDVERAERYAQQALRTYPLSSPSLPRLARDLAWRWMVLGYFARALPLAWEALAHFTVPADRALLWSDIARAAAGAGAIDKFEDAWAQTRVLFSEYPMDPWPADILVNLAHAAASVGERSRANWAATRAVETARARKESTLVLAAEAILDSLAHAPALTVQVKPTSKEADLLVDRFVARLRAARAAT
jgi:tetratricopeptide (TPR) repeat protein